MCRMLRTRGRWRPCVVPVVCYLLAVLVVENILMAWNADMRLHTTPRTRDVVGAASQRPPATPGAEPTSPEAVQATSLPPTTTTPDSRVVIVVAQQRTTTRSVAELELEFYRRRPVKVNPFVHRVLLSPAGMCRPDTVMVVLVHTHHPHADRRAAIRKTWGGAVRTGAWPVNGTTGSCCRHIELAFVVGLHLDPGMNDAIAEEHATHDDIVQGDFVDSYRNMTLKSLLGLKFVDERCPKVTYLLKTDDDMVVNLPYLVDRLTAGGPMNRSIVGPLNVGSRVYRHGKWKLTKEEFPFSAFPAYESGSAYVISADLVHDLLYTRRPSTCRTSSSTTSTSPGYSAGYSASTTSGRRDSRTGSTDRRPSATWWRGGSSPGPR